ncbi:hypothetical protein NUW54_g14632 [Trametes sanguinea]|uniref:Uncharacterized protein n=1 Tax=Trametes sanguinea TaxID=158606 RepID=A0ACC1MBE2_9APHY|nr:hypothetical protein NUW54_g14632 [Trametes sanguinea]
MYLPIKPSVVESKVAVTGANISNASMIGTACSFGTDGSSIPSITVDVGACAQSGQRKSCVATSRTAGGASSSQPGAFPEQLEQKGKHHVDPSNVDGTPRLSTSLVMHDLLAPDHLLLLVPAVAIDDPLADIVEKEIGGGLDDDFLFAV